VHDTGHPTPVWPRRHLLHVLAATLAVAVAPVGTVWGLRASGAIASPWVCVALAAALSLGASAAGSACWRRRGSDDVLFSELLPWGWLWRRHVDRELARARMLLAPERGREGAGTLSVEQRTALLRRLARAVEAQDPYLSGHSRRVARYVTIVADRLGLPRAEVERIGAAALIHDVGKVGVPAAVLNKPGRLTDAEYEIVKRHPVLGAQLVAALDDPDVAAIVRHHHERLDGGGYPDGLAGGQIPLGARIVAVADTFDAVTSARPYRPAARHKKGLDILLQEAGTQLDSDAVRAFVAHYSGRRPAVLWATVTASPRRALAWLARELDAAPGLPAAKVAASAVATMMIAAVAVAPPLPPPSPASAEGVSRAATVGYRAALPAGGAARSQTGSRRPASAPAGATASRVHALRLGRARRPASASGAPAGATSGSGPAVTPGTTEAHGGSSTGAGQAGPPGAQPAVPGPTTAGPTTSQGGAATTGASTPGPPPGAPPASPQSPPGSVSAHGSAGAPPPAPLTGGLTASGSGTTTVSGTAQVPSGGATTSVSGTVQVPLTGSATTTVSGTVQVPLGGAVTTTVSGTVQAPLATAGTTTVSGTVQVPLATAGGNVQVPLAAPGTTAVSGTVEVPLAPAPSTSSTTSASARVQVSCTGTLLGSVNCQVTLP
jgi:HD domain